MKNIQQDDEKRLLAYLYDGGFKQTMSICFDIGVSYASVMRYRSLDDPLSRLRYDQFRKLVDRYNAERGGQYVKHTLA